MDLRNKKVLIVGFGRSGQAAARYCLDHGACVSVTDKRPSSDFDLRTAGMNTYFGSHPSSIFEKQDLIVVSPGVPLDIEGITRAKAKGIPVIGEFELADIKAPIIAVTGTNGKSTVTTLIGRIMKEAGLKVAVGGNLGTPLLDMLDDIGNAEYVVLEVSSYQLEISPSFHPNIALLLNITPDHIDRYGSMQAYIDAKALIVRNMGVADVLIYNEEDDLVRNIAENSKARKIGFSAARGVEGLDLSKAGIEGAHNKENMIAAALAAAEAGVDFSVSQKVFEGFTGLPHRNQFVREVNGVRFFDDSKGTNVGAVVKSLEGFRSKVILIAGGLDKGGSYDPLKPLVRDKVKALVLIGEAREIMARELGGLTTVIMADSMEDAVKESFRIADKGDVVLLSPACASFDMFKDYADRGNRFAEAVMRL